METLNEWIWSCLFLPLMLLCGGVLTLRCGGLQFRRFGLALRKTVGGGVRGTGRDGVSPFEAASTALAATVGTGNIVGTAQAIAMGGAGAVFWLWAAAGLGMILKYAEIFLCIRCRHRGSDGQWQGGPMAYIRLALGKGPAALYALLAALSALCMGNMSQVNGAVSAVCAVAALSPAGELRLRLGLGLLIALTAAHIATGGAGRAGRLTVWLVPLMSGLFLLMTGAVILCHAAALPGVLRRIVTEAFRPRAALGAAGGLTLRQTMQWGFRRGAFSNEAGLGSAALAHVAAEADDPAEQGLWGIFEVFADTLVICSATALAILCSGAPIPWGSVPGPELLQSALATVFGAWGAGLFMAAALGLFGLTTVISCSLYGQRCAAYLLGERGGAVYGLCYAACAVPASVLSTAAVWAAADTVNALLALPNLLALLLLSGTVGRETRQQFAKDAKQGR